MALDVIVCGGRDYENEGRIRAVLRWLRPDTIIHGACRTGADAIAARIGNSPWMRRNGVMVVPCRAEWEKLGRGADPARNASMLTDHPRGLVVAFHGGDGTLDTVRRAVTAGRSVLLVDGGPVGLSHALQRHQELAQTIRHQERALNALRENVADLQAMLEVAEKPKEEASLMAADAFSEAVGCLRRGLRHVGLSMEESGRLLFTDLAMRAEVELRKAYREEVDEE
jgi:hypothetical protein